MRNIYILEMSSTIEKLRKPKIMDMAIFDWLATAAVAAVIGAFARSQCTAIIMFIILVLIGIITHHALGIPTMFNAYLGLADKRDVYKSRGD